MTCPRMLAATRLCVRGMSQSVRVLNEEGFREAAQRDKDSWDTMAAKVPTNHVEKNLYLLSQAARLTIDNTCLLPNPLRKKKQAKYGRRGKKARGRNDNVNAIPLGTDGHNKPWYLSVPKHHFKTDGVRFINLSLGSLQHKIDMGKLDPSKITMYDLVSQNIIKIPKDYSGIQLSIQGVSVFEAKVNIEVTMACDRTIEAIERNGGTVLTRWYSADSIQSIREGVVPAQVDLPPKAYIHKYLSPELRGYMVGREYLFFRSLDKADELLSFMQREDPVFSHEEEHRDIIQERIDANIRCLQERAGTES